MNKFIDVKPDSYSKKSLITGKKLEKCFQVRNSEMMYKSIPSDVFTKINEISDEGQYTFGTKFIKILNDGFNHRFLIDLMNEFVNKYYQINNDDDKNEFYRLLFLFDNLYFSFGEYKISSKEWKLLCYDGIYNRQMFWNRNIKVTEIQTKVLTCMIKFILDIPYKIKFIDLEILFY